VTKCYQTSLEFPSVKRRRVEADFRGGDITSNGGIPLLAQVDRQLGLTQAAAKVMGDSRRQASCEHSLLELLRQCVYALALGYEDLDDHHELRNDLALQTAITGRDPGQPVDPVPPGASHRSPPTATRTPPGDPAPSEQPVPEPPANTLF